MKTLTQRFKENGVSLHTGEYSDQTPTHVRIERAKELVVLWLEDQISEEEKAFALTKAPETVENIHNIIMNVYKQLIGDV